MRPDKTPPSPPFRRGGGLFILALAISALIHSGAAWLYYLSEKNRPSPNEESVGVAIISDPEPLAPEIPARPLVDDEQRAAPPKPAPPPLSLAPKEAHASFAQGSGGGDASGRARAASRSVERREEPETLRDVMLGQVARHWSPPPELKGANKVVIIFVTLSPNGMLAPPLAANEPLDVSKAVAGYETLDPMRRKVLLDLVQALRAAQPFKIPERFAKQAPIAVRLDFSFDQMP